MSLDLKMAQQAIDALARHKTQVAATKALGIPRGAFRHRMVLAQVHGLTPAVPRPAARPYVANRIGRMHLIIPDVQMKHGVRDEHMRWIGNYIVEKQPDVIVQIGDFADMESLSAYLKAKESEGLRYKKDLQAVHGALDKLFAPVNDYNLTAPVKYKPRWVLTLGNHEQRILRLIDDHPKFEGVFGIEDLKYEEYGFEVHPYLKVIKIDGIEYSHFFTSGVKGNACSSAAVQLRERACSSTAGHVQHTDVAIHKKTQQTALFSGTCYLHDEKYLGQQDNCQRRQIVVKNEVEDGRYDLMFVSLKYLEKHYS